MDEFIIDQNSGKVVRLKENDTITIVDLKGEQVVDFFAVNAEDETEFLSTGVTIDCNDSIALRKGFNIFTNCYNMMFQIVKDDVKIHNLLHPCCRPEMYNFFYGNGEGHNNCFDNINNALGRWNIEKFNLIQPVNLFMNTKINSESGQITIEKPISREGDQITLTSKMDTVVAVAVCSVSESMCNGGNPTSIKIEVVRY